MTAAIADAAVLVVSFVAAALVVGIAVAAVALIFAARCNPRSWDDLGGPK